MQMPCFFQIVHQIKKKKKSINWISQYWLLFNFKVHPWLKLHISKDNYSTGSNNIAYILFSEAASKKRSLVTQPLTFPPLWHSKTPKYLLKSRKVWFPDLGRWETRSQSHLNTLKHMAEDSSAQQPVCSGPWCIKRYIYKYTFKSKLSQLTSLCATCIKQIRLCLKSAA